MGVGIAYLCILVPIFIIPIISHAKSFVSIKPIMVNGISDFFLFTVFYITMPYYGSPGSRIIFTFPNCLNSM